MKTMLPCVFDTLESRTFFSGGSSQVVIADRAQIALDVKLMHVDTKQFHAKIQNDRAAIVKATANARVQTQHQVKSDTARFHAMLKADQQAILTAHKVDIKIIQSDRARIRTDHANASLEAQDETQLQLDEQKMSDDASSLESHLQADESAEASVITADEQQGEANANSVNATLQAQLDADTQQCEATLQGDADRLQSAHLKLEVDLQAEAHGSTTA